MSFPNSPVDGQRYKGYFYDGLKQVWTKTDKGSFGTAHDANFDGNNSAVYSGATEGNADWKTITFPDLPEGTKAVTAMILASGEAASNFILWRPTGSSWLTWNANTVLDIYQGAARQGIMATLPVNTNGQVDLCMYTSGLLSVYQPMMHWY